MGILHKSLQLVTSTPTLQCRAYQIYYNDQLREHNYILKASPPYFFSFQVLHIKYFPRVIRYKFVLQ